MTNGVTFVGRGRTFGRQILSNRVLHSMRSFLFLEVTEQAYWGQVRRMGIRRGGGGWWGAESQSLELGNPVQY